MKYLLLVATILLAVSASVRAASDPSDLDAWLKSQSRPPEWYGVYIFSARWCSNCPSQKAAAYGLSKEGYITVQKGSGKRAHFVIVDYDINPELAAKYGVKQLPCCIGVRGGKAVNEADYHILEPDELKALWMKCAP